jgi:hypothetical protein
MKQLVINRRNTPEKEKGEEEADGGKREPPETFCQHWKALTL